MSYIPFKRTEKITSNSKFVKEKRKIISSKNNNNMNFNEEALRQMQTIKEGMYGDEEGKGLDS